MLLDDSTWAVVLTVEHCYGFTATGSTTALDLYYPRTGSCDWSEILCHCLMVPSHDHRSNSGALLSVHGGSNSGAVNVDWIGFTRVPPT
jgi:hypothetical protein